MKIRDNNVNLGMKGAGGGKKQTSTETDPGCVRRDETRYRKTRRGMGAVFG